MEKVEHKLKWSVFVSVDDVEVPVQVERARERKL